MSQQNKLMGVGQSAASAAQIVGDVASGLTAAGTGQSTALALSCACNYVETVASGTGVRLYGMTGRPSSIGDEQAVYNAGANTLSVYPPSGEQIVGAAQDAAFSVPAGVAVTFKKVKNTLWLVVSGDAAFERFMQSGTGALTRAVSAALAAIVRRGDFDTLAHYNTAVTALTERIGVAALDITKTVTDSSVGNNTITFTTTDTSPPVTGAGILNTWFAPAYRFDIISQAGTTTGSHAGILVYMPSIKGKSSTTLTAGITANASPQSVAVADSSIFPSSMLPLSALIGSGLGSGKSETVTVTAVADSTHITAVFSNNHSSGELVLNNYMGVKNALGVQISDQAGNTNDLFAMNPNITAVSATPGHNVVASEMDVTNSSGVDAAKHVFDIVTGGPFICGEDIQLFGSKKVSAGLLIASGDAVCQAWNAIAIEGGGVNAITITNGGTNAMAPVAAIAIQSAQTYGVIIGKNQTAATNPVYTLTDPTHGIYLTSRGTSGSVASNSIVWQSLNASVSHTFGMRHDNAGGGLQFEYDGTGLTTFIGTDGAVNCGNLVPFRVRDSGLTTMAQFVTNGVNVSLEQVNTGVLTINATVINITSGGSTTISTGVGSVKMSTANAATNAVWIPHKYAGTTYYIPGWTTNAP